MKGLYLYGVRIISGSLLALRGLERGTRVFAVPTDGCEALVSEVRAASADAWQRRCLTDLTWVRTAILRHHEVIQRVQRASTVLPLKFGAAVFAPTARQALGKLRHALAPHRELFRQLLQQVAGKEEWGVVLVVQEAKFAAQRAGRREAARGARLSAGERWYQAQKRAAAARAALDGATEERVRELVERVHPLVVGLVGHAVSPGSPAPGTRRLAALACLVEQERVPSFQAALASFRRAYERQGFRIETSGPWAPYHFVDLAGVGDGVPQRAAPARAAARATTNANARAR